MWNINPDKIVKMCETMANRHRGEMHALYLDWEIKVISHPRYEGKIEQIVPLLVIDFK